MASDWRDAHRVGSGPHHTRPDRCVPLRLRRALRTIFRGISRHGAFGRRGRARAVVIGLARLRPPPPRSRALSPRAAPSSGRRPYYSYWNRARSRDRGGRGGGGGAAGSTHARDARLLRKIRAFGGDVGGERACSGHPRRPTERERGGWRREAAEKRRAPGNGRNPDAVGDDGARSPPAAGPSRRFPKSIPHRMPCIA